MGSAGAALWKFTILLLLCLTFCSVLAQSSSSSGRRKCKLKKLHRHAGFGSGGRKFHYRSNHVYAYDYVLNGTTSIDGGPTEQSGLHLSCQATVKFVSTCEAVLFLSNVSIWESQQGKEDDDHVFSQSSGSQSFSESLEAVPLWFSYADGVIEEIYVDPRDSASALNIKRGLLSAFQNTMTRLDLEHKGEENDIHGRCKVEYELGTATSSSLTLVKTKDLNSCGDKFGSSSSIQGVPYNFGTKHQSMPAVSSTATCEQVVDRNLMAGVSCREAHRLKSLSRGAAGAVTVILQKLTLRTVYTPSDNSTTIENNSNNTVISTEDEDELPPMQDPEEDGSDMSFRIMTLDSMGSSSKTAQVISSSGSGGEALERSISSKRDSLLFQNEYHTGPTSNDFQTAKKALTQFCTSLKDGVELRSGKLFESLLNILRGLSSQHMMNLAQEAAQICHGDRNHFDGILEAVGTAASMTVIKEKISKGDASPETIHSWISSLTYIPKPDSALLDTAIDLLRGPVRNKYPNVLLSYSNLAHAYCRDHPKCSSQQSISKLSQLYEIYFHNTRCDVSKVKDIEQIIFYLKGIGNFGMSTLEIERALRTCILRQKLPEIRVAAVDAYRRMSCGYNTSALVQVFQAEREDSEVRIAAFLGLMRCPTYETIRLIKQVLETEQVNQVGSFVWTYLKNLQETALPSRAELQGLVADEKLTRKFSTNVRKFSNNFEISTFYDDMNFGAGMESNVIYSQDSYIPRSMSLNLTVDLFGESINVLEASVRLENLEHYVESIWGPNGKLSSGESNGPSQGRRQKRAVPSKRKLRTLAIEYDAMRRYYSDPIASLSLKTFGNEILYKRKVGIAEQTGWLKSLNPLEYLQRLGDKDTNWEKSTMLLDSSYIIPTGAGLPLNLSATAWSILSVEARNMIDAGNFRANSELKLTGKLQPSALLTVTGSMALGLSRLQTGIKIRANVRSSAAVEGNFHIKGSQLVHLDFGIPQSQIDVIEYASELVFLKGKDEITVGSLPDESKRQKDCLFRGIFGLELCGSSYFTLSADGGTTLDDDNSFAPYFPLNGPAHLVLSLHKANPDLMRTRIIYEWNHDEREIKLTTAYEQVTRASSEGNTITDELFGLKFQVDKSEGNASLDATFLQTRLEGKGRLGSDWGSGGLEFSLKNKGTNNIAVERLAGQFQFESLTNSNGDKTMRPSATIRSNSQLIFETESELRVTQKQAGIAFDGQGSLKWRNGPRHNLETRGSKNDTAFSLVINSEYESSPGNTAYVRYNSVASQVRTQTGSQTFLSVTLEMSEYPDYNFGTSWKQQSSEGRSETETDIRLGRGPSWSDRTALKIRQASTHQKSHEGQLLKWTFYISKPSHHIDYGFDVSLNRRGKSLDSSINLRYAPGKNLQTSLSLKRAPGVLTFLQIGWNITLPNQPPLQFTLHLEEKTHRVYEALISTDWFGRNNITMAVGYSDKSKKNLLNTTIQFAVQTRSTEELKFSARLFHQEDKELKIVLGMSYGTSVTSVEIGHTQWLKGKRHRAYGSFQQGPHVHLVSADVETDRGFRCVIKTDFDSKLPDIYVNISSSMENGIQLFTWDYKWDATGDNARQFLLETLVDSAPGYVQRVQLIVMYPGHHILIGGDYTIEEEEGHVVNGRIKWNGEKHFHLRASVTPESEEQADAYKIVILVDTPIQGFQTASVHARYANMEDISRDISFEIAWGTKERIEATILLSSERIEADDDDEEDEGEGDDDDEEGENEPEENAVEGKKKKKKKSSRPGPFIWSLRANVNSSMEGYESFRLGIQHRQISLLNVKTDIDVQLPDQREISIGNEWILPRRLRDILSSRLVLSVKTPFIGYQTTTLQAILGQQEDSNILGVVGLYTENLHYSITITGTPRFEEDGALGFEMATSNPEYDKIFARFDYAVGDTSRLACQLGWPQFLISFDSALQWNGWEDFLASLTFNSPWEPLKNVNALARLDTAQVAELKLELNDRGINGKCEWDYESLWTMEGRLTMGTPWESFQQAGVVVKNAFETEDGVHSQILAWVNDKKLGYEFEGGSSEIEEEDVLAIVKNGRLELELLVYPTIRSTFSLEQRENKFKFSMSLLLPDGPINVSANLDLIDVYVFNEKIVITTPFESLVELEINLNPAFIPDADLYNFGLTTRWRSGSNWKEGGLVIRFGDQNSLMEVMQQDIDFGVPADEDEEEVVVAPAEETKIPTSQFFHFYSPICWVEEIKMEFEQPSSAPGSDDTDQKEEEGEQEEDQIPFKTLVMAYSGYESEIRLKMTNEQLRKNLYARLRLTHIPEPVSVEVDGRLDLSEDERKLNIVGISYEGQRKEVSLASSWEHRSNFLNARGELRTPFDNFEVQHVQIMYAHSEPDEKSSITVEVGSSMLENSGGEEEGAEEVGSIDATIMFYPGHFSLQVQSPFADVRTLEVIGDTQTEDGDAEDVKKTQITATINDREIQIDVESIMENEWPSSVTGTLSSSLKGQTTAKVTAGVQNRGDTFRGTGNVDWGDKGKLTTSLVIQMPQNRFEQLEVKVDAPFDQYEHWELFVHASDWAQTEDGTKLLKVEIKGKTPFAQLETTEVEAIMEMGSSFLDVKKATVSGKTPSGSVDVGACWMLEKWNSFDIQCNSSYYVLLPSTTLPEKNFLKFKLRNEIPTLASLSLIDSHFFFQTAHLRLGGSTLVEYEEDSSLTVKLSSYLPQTSPRLELQAKFDHELGDIEATLEASQGEEKTNLRSTFQLKRQEDSLDGAARVEWGAEELESGLQSRFNCSFTDEQMGVHLELFRSQIKSRPSGRRRTPGPAGNPAAEQEVDERQVSLLLDGTFNKISGSHNARVQAGRPRAPVIMDIHVGYQGLSEIDSSFNVTTTQPFYNITAAGLRLSNSIQGNHFQGTYGGHWGLDEAFVDYTAEYQMDPDDNEKIIKLAGTLSTRLPFTKKFPSAVVQVGYEIGDTTRDGQLRAEFNGTRLFGLDYHDERSESSGVELEEATLKIDNQIWPLGLGRSYKYNYGGGLIMGMIPQSEVVYGLEVYDLTKPDENKLRGEISIAVIKDGRIYNVKGIHPTRTLELATNYRFPSDNSLKHETLLTWSPQSSLGYTLQLVNSSSRGTTSYKSMLKVKYPVREVTLDTEFQQKGHEIQLRTVLNPNSGKSDRKLEGKLKLDASGDFRTKHTSTMDLIVKHPALTQDIRTSGELRVLDGRRVEGDLYLDYSGNDRRKVTLTLRTPTVSLGSGEWNVTSDMRLEHPVTNLDLRASHRNQHSSQQLSIITWFELIKKGEKVGQKSKITFELFKQLRKLLIMFNTPEDQLNVIGNLKGQYPTYSIDGIVNGTGNATLAKTLLDLNMDKPYYKFYALCEDGLIEGLLSEGGVRDNRNIQWDITELMDGERSPHISFYLRLNHSRLLTSKLKWRPDLGDYLEEWYRKKSAGVRNAWSQQSDKLLLALSSQASAVTEQIWEDAKTAIGPFIQEMRKEVSLNEEIAALEAFVNRTWENNDFYVENITAFANLMKDEISLRFSNVFLRLRDYRKELFGDSSQMFEKTLLWILEKLRESYRQLVTAWHAYRRDSPPLSLSIQPLREKMSALSDQIAKSLVSWADYWSDLLTRYGSALLESIDRVVQQYKPAIFSFAHKIEDFAYKIFRMFSDFISEKRAEVINSSYYRQAASLADDADRIYKELASNDASTNIRKFYQKLKDYITMNYEEGNLGPLVQEIQRFFSNLWVQLNLDERIENMKQTWRTFIDKARWLSEYLHVDETIQEILVTLYTKGGDLVYQTALEASSRYQKAKTKFTFDPRKGLVELEQRLPMPWAAFNETPVFSELPEYKNILKLQELFQSSNGPFWGAIQRSKESSFKGGWLPPDDGHAMIVGSEYFFTFDGRAYNLSGESCVLLLAGDLVDGNFSVSLQYNNAAASSSSSAGYYIVVTTLHNTVFIDLDRGVVKVMKRGGVTTEPSLPFQLQHLNAYKDGRKLVIESRRGISVSCNLAYRICELRVSGWYSRKTAGLLGTMDDEPTTDMIQSDRKPLLNNLSDMVKSWDVSDDDAESCTILQPARSLQNKRLEPKTVHTCNKLFRYVLSSLQPCFSTVSVDPYVEMCEGDFQEAVCTAAMSYVSMCRSRGVSVKLPSLCIKCDMNGEEMMDRDVREMDAESSGRKSSDIVFIVEAKDCNKNLRDGKKMDSLARILEEEMARANLVSNRYALVLFGGDGVLEKPHQVFHNNQDFTQADDIGQFFANIVIGNGSGDIFEALAFTLNNLRFRPEVSKTFILVPCSSCQPQHLTMDFAAIRYALLEQDATLHILMNSDFSFDDKSRMKKFLGMDKDFGFMKTNSSKLRGETKIRQQVKVPRRVLGYCTQLALQTNGSIFTKLKLQNRKAENVKLFSTVFSQRVVQTARPAQCQTCYCSPDQVGVGRIQCFLCDYSRYKALPAVDSSSESDEEDYIKPTSQDISPGRAEGRGNEEDDGDGSDEDELEEEE